MASIIRQHAPVPKLGQFNMKILLLFTLALFSLPSLSQDRVFRLDQFGAISNDSKDDSQAIQTALSSLNPGDILVFPAGVYDVCQTLYLTNTEQISLIGSQGSVLRKCSDFVGEYLLYIKEAQGMFISGIHFLGLNNGDVNQVWGEQGVYLASTSESHLSNNTFENFGDAALRVTTGANPTDSPSQNAILFANTFRNCGQVTTTQATQGSNVPGTQNITFEYNLFQGCTLKLSSRKQVEDALVFHNTFRNISSTALEISYYTNVTVKDNKFDNISGFIMNVFPNTRAEQPVDWGNIDFQHNDIFDSTMGIRLQSFSANESPTRSVENISISHNRFSNITCEGTSENKYKKIIRTYSQNSGYSFKNVNIIGNQYDEGSECDFLSIDTVSGNIKVEENKKTIKVDGN
ncbi:right-handed parallel beta-helix repeat-containing protein [Vibrio neptunius]|uniref:Right-handed parallel beta-helix repeat-containing protein n=2 Tax=Vibrio neptunius TaxID=170651 RepID=A0ABS3A4A1_9VIBR|nr:right-handed parallel beta-helix repeat-containing protein [Vibrio neptunius]MBN3516367.1 right-handed parallel beta-helix repeat-containing protein [Vibrio neptunius]MBN3550480.1 right-handed parallel beta-helix repeat-containing protein [Vibrio neptunius]MBN3578611.1 right-handed parallel beta-helix repeat-containing protein [Vibrio neptunius]MCH9872276.1 right-handed parallel beta-helix repeat-containing protein [Vibrio neptunius]